MADTLPAGWATSTIGDIATVNPVGSSVTAPDDALVTFLPMAAVEELSGKIDVTAQRPFREVKKNFTRFRNNDVLFAKITPSMENGKVVVAHDLRGGVGCGTTEFHVIRPAADVAPDYLRLFLVQSRYRHEAKRNMQGAVGQQRVPADFVRESEIPLAPANEQWRICSKIDELFSRIDEGEQALKRVEKLVERYRQSVLKAAVTGELTRDWREARKRAGEPVESGEALLARILKARRTAWETTELAKLKAKGRSPIDDRWKQKYQEPAPPDATDLPELPEGWVWCSGAQLFEWSSGDFLPAKAMQSGNYVVYGGNGINGSHDSWNVDAATLVIGRVGAHCGNVYRTTGKCWITDNAIFATSTPHWSSLAYLELCLRSAKLRSQAQGGAQPFVNQKALNEVAIPLPSVQEQDAIVSIVDDELDGVQRLVVACKDETVRSAALRQSILKAAFAGQLVPQDPHDEPASKLLERIAAERAAAPTPRKRRGVSRVV